MASTATTLERFRAAVAVLEELPTESVAYSTLTEDDLLEANRLFGRGQVALRNGGAHIAGEIAHRSKPELGSRGLAQRSGHRTAEQFVKITTGATGRDAVTAVRVGLLMRDDESSGDVDVARGDVAQSASPWLTPVTEALLARTISIEAADAIRAGIGNPTSSVSVELLAIAATELCAAAATLDPDAVGRQARAYRDELDLEGVALREEERRQKRSLRLFVQADGTTRLVWTMDPETAASVRELYDRTTSPNLGGVRFVDDDRLVAAETILRDDRTPEQLASDGFAQLLALGAATDPDFVLGSGAPAIRITTTRDAVESGVGLARIDGQQAPVAVATAIRLTCGGSMAAVTLDGDHGGAVLDFGREQRFFTHRQKEALAVTWGGCAAPGCERPPSWCEAHHIVFWARDRGRTDLADGVLLCRHHHLLFHNNGWEIERDARAGYWLIPPIERDPARVPIRLHTRTAARRATVAAGIAAAAE